MSHLDEESLAAIALGDGSDADAVHARECEACATAVADYERLTQSLGALDGTIELQTPPVSVWKSIAAATGADASTESAQPDAPAPAPTLAPAAEPEPAPGGVTDELAQRRARRSTGPSWWALAGAAAAGVVVGGVGVSLASADGGEPADVVASAPLAQLQTESSAGTADLEVREDGTQILVVETDYEELTDAYLEVWLIDEDIDGMVSLGHLTGDRTEFTLPEGFDVELFPIVDISIEPTDGVPTHSGDSVTRGVLET
ncbi:anti-sigma factor [Demequina sediminicola]|uniref:anti-sigma factor n=1 Tax=Demequina sediminicola TaxID=1095026 RepID=UPI00078372AB|nr:anti-sigma factor [Demequina sediminicola]